MTTEAPQTLTLTEIVLPGVVVPHGVQVQARPIPAPGMGQALVQMLATGVSFAENAMRRGRYPGQPKFPFVPGYDLVGTVVSVGEGVDRSLVGQRVAAVTKTGGWATHALLDARELMPVPGGLDAGDVEALLVNGITAWQMLHRAAGVQRGQTILVHGASGGVGAVLVQLARLAGVRVLGTASPRNHDLVRELGAEPLDYHDPALADLVRERAPGGVDAVFDNLGGDSFRRSFDLLARGGALVAYGTASQLDDDNSMALTFAGILARFGWWTAKPNGRRATFYNFWAGKLAHPARARRDRADDLSSVLGLLAEGELTPRIAARLPLAQAGEALALADSRTTAGKILLVP